MTFAIGKTITHQLTVLYDHSVHKASLVTNIFEMYDTSCPLILAPVIVHVPLVNAPTHFPSICGCKAESQTAIKIRDTFRRNFSIVHSYFKETKKYTEQKYTILDKIRSDVIRKELGISGIQDVRSKHKQNWFNHLERMYNTRLTKHVLNYKPRGRRDHGCPRKRWQRVDARTGQTT